MTWVAVAVAGAAVVGAGASTYSTGKAASASARGANASIAEQARQYDQSRADFAQQRSLGEGATGLLARLYGIGTPGAEGQFDAQAYLAANPDVAADPWASQNPEEHYRRFGVNEGRQGAFTGGTPATPGGTADLSAFTAAPDYQFNLQQGQQAIDRSLAARGRSLSGAGVKEGQRFASGLATTEYGNYVSRLMQAAGLGSTATQSTAQLGANMANQNSATLMNNANNRASLYMQNGANLNNAAQSGASNYLLYQYLNKTPAKVQ